MLPSSTMRGVQIPTEERDGPDGAVPDVIIHQIVAKKLVTRGTRAIAALRKGFDAKPTLKSR